MEAHWSPVHPHWSRVPPTPLTISITSDAVPKAMASSSFWEDFSGTCKCGSWLGASPRATGCWIFAPVFTRASVSSKLELKKQRASLEPAPETPPKSARMPRVTCQGMLDFQGYIPRGKRTGLRQPRGLLAGWRAVQSHPRTC